MRRGLKKAYRIPYGYKKSYPRQFLDLEGEKCKKYIAAMQKKDFQSSKEFVDKFEKLFKKSLKKAIKKQCSVKIIIVSNVRYSQTCTIEAVIRRGLANHLKVALWVSVKFDLPHTKYDII